MITPLCWCGCFDWQYSQLLPKIYLQQHNHYHKYKRTATSCSPTGTTAEICDCNTTSGYSTTNHSYDGSTIRPNWSHQISKSNDNQHNQSTAKYSSPKSSAKSENCYRKSSKQSTTGTTGYSCGECHNAKRICCHCVLVLTYCFSLLSFRRQLEVRDRCSSDRMFRHRNWMICRIWHDLEIFRLRSIKCKFELSFLSLVIKTLALMGLNSRKTFCILHP